MPYIISYYYTYIMKNVYFCTDWITYITKTKDKRFIY